MTEIDLEQDDGHPLDGVHPQNGVHPLDGDDELVVEPEESQSLVRTRVGLIAAAIGLLLTLCACSCGALTTFGLSSTNLSSKLIGAEFLTIASLVGQFGLALIAGGVVIWRGWFSSVFHPRRTWPMWIVFILLVSLGWLLSLVGVEVYLSARVINGLTMLIMPLLVLMVVGRSLRGTGGTWRDVIGGLVGGGVVGTVLALATEAGLAVTAWIAVSTLDVLPGGLDPLTGILDEFRGPESLLDPQTLQQLMNPLILTVALAGVALVAPMVEEISKTLAVGVFGRWLRPTPARAFMLGVASGAGFAVAENLLNSSLVSSYGILAVLSRLAASTMHCAVSGLVGWGWGEFWRERRFKPLILALAGATGLHGLWNGMAFGVAVSGLLAAANESIDIGVLAGSGLMMLVFGLILLVLVILAPVGMLLASRALARNEEMG
jgi:RsiW-degrading membrane proteinase PrsW (M82 family)